MRTIEKVQCFTHSIDPATYIDRDLLSDNMVNVQTLTAGSHRIRVEHPELGAWLCEMDVPANQKKDVNVFLGRETPITVAAQDVGTGEYLTNKEIYIDDVKTGFTTPETFAIASGLRKIELKMDEYELVGVDLSNGAGCFQVIGNMINVDLESARGRDRPLVELKMKRK